MTLPFASTTNPEIAPKRRTAQKAARSAITSRVGVKMSRSCMAALSAFSSLMRQMRRKREGGDRLT